MSDRRIEAFLVHQLRAEKGATEKLALVSEALRTLGSRFDAETMEIVAAELKSCVEIDRPLLESLPPGANAAYLRAVLASGTDGAWSCTAWERFFAQHYSYDPFHRLAFARALASEGRFPDAARQLQLALSQPQRYAFFPRAEKLIRIVAGQTSEHLRQVRVAVLGTSTTTLLVPVLEALCLRDGIRVEIYQGLYGAVDQEILDSRSGLAAFRPDIVFLVNHWRDLALPPVVADVSGLVEQVAGRQKTLWDRLSSRFACHVVQHGFDFPAEDPYGPLSGSLPGGRARVIAAINERLDRLAPSYVSVLDTVSVQRHVGSGAWEDAGLWHSFKQHPATEALPALADAQQAHLRAVLGLTRKVLVVDLDNTLWKGVIGEDGLDGIQIGPGTAAGEAHQRLQEYLRDLRTRGILLAVCSKNNPEDARLPFEKREHMVLRLDDFAAFQANWNDKAQNLREIAEKLSLGLDSFVFLDDSPLEREWVRSQLPQVAVVELGPSVFHYVRDLDRGRHFFALSLSKEDLARAEQYRTESQREMLRSSSQSLDEFLSQLQLEASVVPVSGANLARVTQLANKTNQFNLTTRRYTEARVERLASEKGTWAGAFQLSDRMGSYGLIGLIFCVPAGPSNGSPREWEVETWLMSCRALGRQMERFMLDRLLEAAAEAGVRELTGVYRPTPKNGLVANLYDNLGFSRMPAQTGDEIRYSLIVPDPVPVTATHIRDLTSRAEGSALAPARPE
jgi:FkbH-like protein